MSDGLTRETGRSEAASFMTGVYGWMTFALGLSGLVAYLVGTTPNLIRMVASGPALLILALAEIGLVMFLSGMIHKLAAATATALFVAYAALNGLTLSFIFLAYQLGSIASTFFITAGTFGAMALYGAVTKRDLTKMGSVLLMLLIGVIIASIVNIFWANSTLYWIITFAGVLIFTLLTAYDTQKILRLRSVLGGDPETERKIAILGALTLYLDFVNLFLYLLRIFGRRR